MMPSDTLSIMVSLPQINIHTLEEMDNVEEMVLKDTKSQDTLMLNPTTKMLFLKLLPNNQSGK